MSTGYDGSIRINTKIDTKDGEKKVSSLGKKFKSFGKIIASVFAITAVLKFTKATMSAYQTQTTAELKVTQALKNRYNATQEVIKSVYDLASAEQAAGVVGDEVQLEGIKTLTGFADSVEQVKGLTHSMNDLLAYNFGYDANGANAESVAQAMGKAINDGSLRALKTMGIAVDQNTAKMFELADKSERVAMLNELIEKRVGGTNAALANTPYGRIVQLKNSWGDFKEVIGQAATNITSLFVPALTSALDLLNILAGKLVAVSKAMTLVFGKSNANENITKTAEDAANAQEKVAESIEDTGEAIAGNLASFDELNIMNDAAAGSEDDAGDVVGGGSSAEIGEESEVSSDLISAAEKFKDVIAPALALLKTLATDGAAALKEVWANVLSPMFNFLVPAIKKLIEGLTTLYEAVIKPLVQMFGSKLLPVYKQFYEAMADNIEGANSFGEFVSKSLETVGNAAKSLLDALVELFPQVLDIGLKVVKNLVKGITDALPSIVKAAGDMVKTLISAIVDNLPMIIETALTIILALVDTLLDNLPLIIETAIDLILALIEGILQCLPQIIEAAIQLVIGLAQGITDALPHLLESAMQIIGRLWDTIMNTDWWELGKNILLAIINGIGSLITNGVEMMKNFVTSIVNIFKNTNWLEVGKNILKGIGNGIKNAVTGVVDMAKNACKSIWNGIKSFFGIHSPSTLMRDTVGNNIALGIGEGFEGEINGVADNMEKALADELDTSWSGLVDELAGVPLPDIGLKELLPVQVSSEIIKSDDKETFEEIRDDVAEIARNVEELKNKKGDGSTVQSGGLTTRNGETIDPRRENRKAGKTIYPVGT